MRSAINARACFCSSALTVSCLLTTMKSLLFVRRIRCKMRSSSSDSGLS